MTTPQRCVPSLLQPLNVRIVSLDYYMARPLPQFDETYTAFSGTAIERVPVVRVFGTTPAGQTACVHLHKAFPSFYLACDADGFPSNSREISSYLSRVGAGLEAAMQMQDKTKSEENAEEGKEAAPRKPKQHVHNVQLVRAKKFYGYHPNETLFMKIIMYNPREIGKAAMLLQMGAVMGVRFQPYESHIPYLLQLKIDFNLAGMSHLKLERGRFRSPLPKTHIPRLDAWTKNTQPILEPSLPQGPSGATPPVFVFRGTPSNHVWLESTIPTDRVWSEESHRLVPRRQSCCQIEIDSCVEDVLNRLECIRMPLESAGDDERLVESLIPMWDEEKQRLGTDPPARPPSPERNPVPLCDAIEAIRKDLKDAVKRHRSEVQNHAAPSRLSFDGEADLSTVTQAANVMTGPQHPNLPSTPQASQCPDLDIQASALIDVEAISQARSHGTGDEMDNGDPLMVLAEIAAEEEGNGDDDETTLSQEEEAARNLEAFLMGTQADTAEQGTSRCFSQGGPGNVIPQLDGSADSPNWVEGKETKRGYSSLNLEVSSPPSSLRIKGKPKFEFENKLSQRRSPSQSSTPVRRKRPTSAGGGNSAKKRKRKGMGLFNYFTQPSSPRSRGQPSTKPLASTADDDFQFDVVTTPPILRNTYCSREEVESANKNAEIARSPFLGLSDSDQEGVLLKHVGKIDGFASAGMRVSNGGVGLGAAKQVGGERDGDRELVMSDAGEEVEQEHLSLSLTQRREDLGMEVLTQFVDENAPEDIEMKTPVVRRADVLEDLLDGEISELPRPEVETSKEEEGGGMKGKLYSSSRGGGDIIQQALPGEGSEAYENLSLGFSQKYADRGSNRGDGGGSRPLRTFRFRRKAPLATDVNASLGNCDVMPIAHVNPFFGNPKDAPKQPNVMVGMEFNIPTKSIEEIPPFSDGGFEYLLGGRRQARSTKRSIMQDENGCTYWVPRVRPPGPQEVHAWRNKKRTGCQSDMKGKSKIDVTSQQGSGVEQLTMSMQMGTPEPSSTPQPPEAVSQRPPSPKYDEPCFFTVVNSTVTTPATSPQNTPEPEIPHQSNTRNDQNVQPVSRTPTPVNHRARRRGLSQITPFTGMHSSRFTPVSQAGFKKSSEEDGQQLIILSIEIHADCRGSLLPDPRYDSVRCIVMSATNDADETSDGVYPTHVLLFDPENGSPSNDGLGGIPECVFSVYSDEKNMFQAFMESVRDLDPDVLMGFEVQQESLGFLVDRANQLEINLLREISRLPGIASVKEFQDDAYGRSHAAGYHSSGRIILNLWRVLRGEITLNIYTFESCSKAVLQKRVPFISHVTLASWFGSGGQNGGRWRCVNYFLRRARMNIQMVVQLDLIGRTSEMARTYGIDFFSVLSRGSQYRVESMTVRLAHTQNYLMISPSKEQVFKQPAMECLPLVMEPESRMYTAPVVVLDFQSLYPSMIIANNLCYSTCVGRPEHVNSGKPGFKLGVMDYSIPAACLGSGLSPDELQIMPNGISYASKSSRPGVLPRLLREILMTRIMVKAAMKRHPKSAKVLQRCLNARQYGLKMIANVTYGYTAAGFSGRMPFAELADSIVQSGREVLQNAIHMVESNPEWNAKVKYGDTDSMFVLLEGRTREEAFRIGKEIAKSVTAANRTPVELKMEKVYQPCFLQTKKRYVGFSYESPDQEVPIFDAKGIETVRRDACPAVSKMLERVIRILFTTKDISQVKGYLYRQWSKILSGRISLQDFVFAKEVRLGSYSSRAATVPPAAIVAAKAMTKDPRAEPRQGARVPYVVVCGEPGARLVDMVVDPHTLIDSNGRLRLHSLYYITKQINPAINRLMLLVGIDVNTWFGSMPRPQRLLPQKRPNRSLPLLGGRGKGTGKGGTIDSYYLSRHCAVCDELTYAAKPLCECCENEPQLALAVLTSRHALLHRQFSQLVKVCLHCGGGGGRKPDMDGNVVCRSLDCGIYYERKKLAKETATARALADAASDLF
ncbi:hypothetical protein BSKO_11469 [Bryopsis sp. KO-2023]|nr:hypothetical protein BSKO_11469 [Bryopsis sp. KO-2023]